MFTILTRESFKFPTSNQTHNTDQFAAVFSARVLATSIDVYDDDDDVNDDDFNEWSSRWRPWWRLMTIKTFYGVDDDNDGYINKDEDDNDVDEV